jgi:hypothetical protein
MDPASGGLMRKRLSAVVHGLLLLQILVPAAIGADGGRASKALWRFDTHG